MIKDIKVGDKVWVLYDPYFVAPIFQTTVDDIIQSDDKRIIVCYYDGAEEEIEVIEDYVFATEAEAEAKRSEDYKNYWRR